MSKTILIELTREWVAEHANDSISPIENLICKLQKVYPEGLTVTEREDTFAKIQIDVSKRLPATVVRMARAIFNETYPHQNADGICTVSVLRDAPAKPTFAKPAKHVEEAEEAETVEENATQTPAEESIPEKTPEQLAEEKELQECLDTIKTLIGAEDFKALADELVCIAPQIIQNKTFEALTNQTYLFSINEGYGCSTCVSLLASLMHLLHLRNFNTSRPVAEVKLLPPKGDSQEPFESAFKALSGKENAVRMVSIDISEWLNEINSRTFKGFLLDLSRDLENHVILFRIPFVEKDVLEKVKASLGDLMSVRDVSFPPLSKQEITQFAQQSLDKFGFTMQEEAWDCFHARITEERSDGKFYGLTTIQKVVRELMYQKQLHNAKNAVNDFSISRQNALAICRNPEENAVSGMEQLSRLVGSDAIRARVEEILSQIEMARASDSLSSPCIHMRFVGNPGTGKTTVARIIGKILKERGVLRVGNFYEYAGRDFCGRYIGETAPKTASMCRDAYGSILFIDEAYSLYRGDGNDRDFGREALDTLIAEMENHRGDLVVIMAGYPDDMDRLMRGNAGLASRMPYVIEFPNFTRDELYSIYVSMLEGRFGYDEDLLPAVRDFFDSISDSVLTSKEFSNARFVRNLFERTWAKAAMRCQLAKISTITITKDDFDRSVSDKEFVSMLQKKKPTIGFAE